MPWTGSVYIRDNGVFTGPLVWTDDRDAGTKITAAHHDTHDQDIADGITACINKSGANTVAANINWGGFKIVNLANGVSASDAAAFGQTITAASLNPTTNLLTLTRAAGNVTVDLSALVVGGDTSDFARYSNAANPFQGSATFEGTLGALYGLSLVDQLTGTGTYTWAMGANTPTNLTITNTSGATFGFTGNSGTASITINGDTVLTTASFNSSNVAYLDQNEVITGIWSFVNAGGLTLPSISIFGGGTNSYTADTNSAGKFYIYGNFSSAIMYMDYDATEKTRLYTDNKRVWNQGNLQVLTAAPTGGVNGDLAVVISGADRGLWTKTGGLWTVLITFP